ncbi:MAG TPA: universal stress protein [Vicinamibacterales bacterium]|nr:universal stress protein [Vicinamibacterales bacterium]
MRAVPRLRRILYATDLSPASTRAFKTALALARPAHAVLTILYVMPPPLPTIPQQYLEAATIDRLDRDLRQWSARKLKALADSARRTGVAAKTLFREGEAIDQILRAARRGSADLIVVGTHGRRGFRKFILGSVAESVVKVAPCPVLTVRGA